MIACIPCQDRRHIDCTNRGCGCHLCLVGYARPHPSLYPLWGRPTHHPCLACGAPVQQAAMACEACGTYLIGRDRRVEPSV